MAGLPHRRGTAHSVARAIRERIRTLEEELAHWQRLLEQCETQPPDELQDGPAAPRPRVRAADAG
jgi:hypothetical protein